MGKINLNLPDETHKKARIISLDENKKFKEYIVECIEKDIKDKKPKAFDK